MNRIWWEIIAYNGMPSWLGEKVAHIFKMRLHGGVGFWLFVQINLTENKRKLFFPFEPNKISQYWEIFKVKTALIRFQIPN